MCRGLPYKAGVYIGHQRFVHSFPPRKSYKCVVFRGKCVLFVFLKVQLIYLFANGNSGNFTVHLHTTMIRKITLSTLLAVAATSAFAQLSGTYSIDASSPASATNYQSVTAAVSDLSTGTRPDGGPVNGPAVSGPVTLRILTGTGPYNEQITFPAITGTSATNTIRLTGGPGREMISFSGTTTADRHVIKISGARHIRLDSLTLLNTDATYGYGVHITNSADSNQVTNCVVNINNASTSANFAGITISGATVTTNGDWGDDNLIQGNNISGGYYGITMRGISTTVFNQRNKVLNNLIQDYYFYGVYCIYQNLPDVSGNNITARSTASTGCYGIYFSTADQLNCERNRVNVVGAYGIYSITGNYQGGTGTARARIVNNMIGGTCLGTTPYGIYVTTNSRNLDIWHNSVSLTSGNGRAIYILSGSGHDVQNNSFAVFGSTTGYAAYISSTTYVTTVNYNNYWAPGSANFIYIGVAYTTATYVGGGGYNANSRHGDPVYISNVSNLHSSAMQLFDAGTNVGITTDFDGQARPMAPTALYDIGADEYTPSLNDAGVNACTSPVQPFGPGTQNVGVTIFNYGASTLTSASINWTVNSIPQTPYAWSGSLVTYTTSAPVTIGTYNFLAGNTYNLKFWTTNPNGSADQNLLNDTLTLQLCVALNGTYTVGGVGADFPTINAAVSQLVCGGVTGPVTVRLNPGQGPFNEQVIIPPVPGTNAARTVRFTGGPLRETVTFGATTTTQRAVFKLNGSRHIVLDSMRITNTGTAYGYGVQITNSADSNVVKNCIVKVDSTATASNFAGITISGATVATNGDHGDNNFIQNNEVSGGYYGITMRGISTTVFNQRNQITGNNIRNYYYYGIYNYAENRSVIQNNTTRSRPTSTTANYGIYIGYLDSLVVERNRIIDPGTYGIYMINTNVQGGTGTFRGRIINNMIGGGFSAATPYGIYVTTSSRNLDIWHNSVSLDNGNGRALYILSGSGHNVQNNSLAVFGSATGYAAYVTNVTYINGMDYNNYYAGGSSNFIYVGSAYNTSTYVGGGGFNTNSRHGDPYYNNNATDLHTMAPQLYDAGTNLGITVDIDGDVRPMLPSAGYDIGADEYAVIQNNAVVVSLLEPANYFCPDSTQAVTVVIKNQGADTIFTLPLTAQMTGYQSGTINYTYNDTLLFGQSDTVTLGTFNSYPGGALNVTVYSSLSGEQIAANDTIQMQMDIVPFAPLATAADDTICAGFPATVFANADGFQHSWYTTPTGGTPVASSDTLVTPPLSSSTTYYIESLTRADSSLTTHYLGGNGCDGAMFDFIPNVNMTLDSFAVNIGGTANETVRVYYRAGTYLGNETNNLAWTLLGQASVTGSGAGQPTQIPIGGLTLQANQTYGIYMVLQSSNMDYTTGTGTFTNSDATLIAGAGLCGLFSGANAGRVFNGTVYYTKEICPNPVRVPVVVSVLPNPAVAFGPDTTVCGSLLLDAGNPGAAFTWSTGDTTQQVSATFTGSFNVTVFDGFCYGRDTIQVTVNTQPTVLAAASAGSVCLGNSDILNAAGASSYLWIPGNLPGASVSVTPSVTTTYTVIGTDTTNGCTDSQQVSVTVNPLPLVGYTASGTAVCQGDSVTLNGTGASTYTWTNGVTNGVPFVPVSSGTYIVTGSDINGCIGYDTTVVITLNPLPAVSYTASDTTVCENASVTLNGTGATSYSWSGGISDGVPFTVTSTATYTVTGTDANGCSNTDMVTIQMNAAPAVGYTASSLVVCAGDPVTLSGTGATSYSWSGGISDGVSFTPAVSGSYIVTGTDGNGCTGMDTASVTVNSLPNVTVTLPFTTICIDDGNATLSGGSPNGGTWSGTGVTGGAFDPSVAGNGPEVITYTYTDINGCIGSATQTVTVDPCVGITEQQAGAGIMLYPNPNNGTFVIQNNRAENITLQIYDMPGQLVKTLTLEAGMQEPVSLEASGMYVVQFVTGDGQAFRKQVIVQK